MRSVAGLSIHKKFGNGQLDPVKDRPTCHMSRFQAYKFTCIFRTSLCDITGYASVLGTSLSLGLRRQFDVVGHT